MLIEELTDKKNAGFDLIPGMCSMSREDQTQFRASAFCAEGACNCIDRISSYSTPTKQTTTTTATRCLVCNAKNTGRPVFVLPDIDRGVLKRCYLCVRHSLPEHIKKNITNTRELQSALLQSSSEAGRNHNNKFFRSK